MRNKPKKQFRGWYIPADVVYLYEDGKINANELILLVTVDSMVSAKKGCWAGNKFLADKLHVGPDLISKMLTKLKKMGLVIQVGFDGRLRYLETIWSRIDPEKVPAFLRNTLEKVREVEEGSGQETEPSLVKNPEAAAARNPCPNRAYTTYTNNTPTNRRDVKQQSLSVPTGTDGACKNPNLSDKKQRTIPSPFHHKCAAKLREAVSAHIKVNCKSDAAEWANQFRIMEMKDQVPRTDIKRAVQWYAANIGGEYVPDAFSAKTFREKYKDGKIPAAMQRADQKTKKASAIFDENGEPDPKLISRIRTRLREKGQYDMNRRVFPEDLDAVLVEMAMEPGSIKTYFV